MPELSEATKKLINSYQAGKESLKVPESVSTIHVDEVAASVAAFYEKIRTIVDWKEEHLMRRAAVIRKLKRRFFERGLQGINQYKNVGESLILELIRGGHFPNDKIAESKIRDAQRIIEKYLFILKNSSQFGRKQRKSRFSKWLLEIAACEIEETLAPSLKERALINYMFELMRERIKVQGAKMDEEEKNIQVYIAVQRALFKLDSPVISYHLLKYRISGWNQISEEKFPEIANNINSILEKIEKRLNHPLADKFYKICERYDTPYLLLGDIISEDPLSAKERMASPENLESQIRKYYQKRLKTLKARIGRAAVYATVSIFITKIALALAVEVPFDRYLDKFNSFALAVNIIFPPLLMFFLVSTIKPPSKGNLERVIMEVMKISYKTEKKDIYDIKISLRKSAALAAIVALFYLFSFVFSFGLITFLLYKLNFSVLSYIIFILFISLIAFAGTKIRQRSKELQVAEGKESFLNVIMDIFAVPPVQLGNWLMAHWQRYNIIANIFNALIDMPLLVFVEFIEQWRYFLKERKEKIH